MHSLTLINHATVLLRVCGVSVLTDPVFSWTLGYYIPRLRKPGIALGDLPPIDLILISHADYDHLNLKSLRRLRRRHQPRIVLPYGLAKYGRRTGFKNVAEMKLWNSVEESGLRITCVPAKHSNKRLPWDRKTTLACCYVIEAGGTVVYFAGDTGYGEHFKEIAGRFSIDIALLPIGAYKPREWFKEIHLHPDTALRAFGDLRARILIPIHWGTFKISDEPMNEPPDILSRSARQSGLEKQVCILQNGEMYEW